MDAFKKGFKTGLPIGAGYFAVAFSLGIIAAAAGLTPFQGFLTSALVNASAGENAAFIAIKDAVPYFEMAIITLVSNIRYVLMSFALSQKIDPKASMIHRLLLGFYLTDEYFALAISQDPYCNLFLWCDQLCRTLLGFRHSSRHRHGQCFAKTSGFGLIGCLVWHVSGHHHPAGKEVKTDHDTDPFEFSCLLSFIKIQPSFRIDDHHLVDHRHLLFRCYIVPDQRRK